MSAATRLVPLPHREPPYDDDPLDGPDGGPRVGPSVGPSVGPPATAGSAGIRPAAVQGTLALAFVLPSGVAAVPEPTAALRVVGPPDVRAWAARLGQALVEVLAGERPAAQLLRWTTPQVLDAVRAAAALAARRPPASRASGTRSTVRCVRVCVPAAGVAEVSLVVAGTDRVRALAIRLEAVAERWRCTAVHLG